MNSRLSVLLTLVVLITGLRTARADEKIAVLATGSEVYSNITVTSVSATDVYFNYSGGMANVKLKKLSPEWQKHFNFDPDKARTAELQQAENKTRYHDEIIHQSAVPPAAVAPKTVVILAPPVWREDLPGALTQAQSENKLVLLDFTGSDWCPWCIKFDHDVLSTPQFALYAQSKLVLVRLDFPRHSAQSDELKQANEALFKQFAVTGYPTYILLSPDAKELGRQVGYAGGGPAAFITELAGFSKL
jgi:thiol-disulfide isomerase/thioredoxin